MSGELTSLCDILAGLDKGMCKAFERKFPVRVHGTLQVRDTSSLHNEILGTIEISSPEEGPLILFKPSVDTEP